MKKKDFISEFWHPEFNSILGKGYRNVVVLTLIFCVAILSIGVGFTAISFLKEKMDNPFVKFLDVVKPYDNDTQLDDLSIDDLKNKYGYNEVVPIRNAFMRFSAVSGESVDAYTRRVDEAEQFAKFLKPYSEIVLTDNKFDNEGWGVIVTTRFLEKLGYKDTIPAFINYLTISKKKIPFPVAGVVKQLPDFTDILVNPKVYCVHKLRNDYEIFDQVSSQMVRSSHLFFPKLSEVPEELAAFDHNVLENPSIVQGVYVQILDNTAGDPNAIEVALKRYNGKEVLDLDRALLPANYEETCAERSSVQIFSFAFTKLDGISDFQKYLFDEHNLKVDMNAVEAKENFNSFERLAQMLSYILIGISIVFVVSFVSKVILGHISDNQKNIGTLKAFGMSDLFVILTYSSFSVVLVSSTFIIGYFFSTFLGHILSEHIANYLLIGAGEQFEYTNYPISYLSLFFLLVPLVLIIILLRRSSLKKTPGDLIYER